MDGASCASSTAEPIVKLGGAFMLDPATAAAGEAFGLDFGGFYALGRGGVLGDVDADVVSAAFVFFNPDVVRMLWEGARAKRAPAESAVAYAGACGEWGRSHLGAVDGLEELDRLLGRVVAAGSPVGAPLFAGWRAMSLPDDAPARVVQQLHVLRELRGGLHAIAVLAGGLSPFEAVLIANPASAALFGWAEPYPDPEPLRATHAEAGANTDRLVAHAFEVLSHDERDRLARLLEDALATTVA